MSFLKSEVFRRRVWMIESFDERGEKVGKL
jgi:hypothetical protein